MFTSKVGLTFQFDFRRSRVNFTTTILRSGSFADIQRCDDVILETIVVSALIE
jgi:hypothetical protein